MYVLPPPTLDGVQGTACVSACLFFSVSACLACLFVIWCVYVVPPAACADAAGADPASSAGHFPEFGPLPSFTPLVSQHAGRSHPFGSSSNNGFADRGSLRTSQDISLLLRSGMLMEAALLSSNASRMHVIHDAGRFEPEGSRGFWWGEGPAAKDSKGNSSRGLTVQPGDPGGGG